MTGKAICRSEEIARRSTRPITKRRLGRLVVFRATAPIVSIDGSVLIGKAIVHLVQVVMVDVLMTGRNCNCISILVGNRFTIPNGPIMFC